MSSSGIGRVAGRVKTREQCLGGRVSEDCALASDKRSSDEPLYPGVDGRVGRKEGEVGNECGSGVYGGRAEWRFMLIGYGGPLYARRG